MGIISGRAVGTIVLPPAAVHVLLLTLSSLPPLHVRVRVPSSLVCPALSLVTLPLLPPFAVEDPGVDRVGSHASNLKLAEALGSSSGASPVSLLTHVGWYES